MFERFTDRARKVMALANQEAYRFNHEYIGTEHMLLGFVKEGDGVGANILKNLDIDFRKVRLQVEKLIKIGPEMVSMGKPPQTPRAKKVVEYAIEESRNLNHNYVGTEHLLLGLLKEAEGVAAQVLAGLGVTFDGARDILLRLLEAQTEDQPDNKIILPKDAEQSSDRLEDERERLGDSNLPGDPWTESPSAEVELPKTLGEVMARTTGKLTFITEESPRIVEEVRKLVASAPEGTIFTVIILEHKK